MNNIKPSLMVLTISWFLVSAVAGGAQTLTDALINAYRNSPQLKSERATLRSTDEGTAQARAALRPSLNAKLTGSQIYSFSTGSFTDAASAELGLKLLLWDGGNTRLGVEVARLNVELARQALIDVEQQVLLNAATAFVDMRRDAEFLELAENNRRVIAKQVQAAKDRFEVGEARRTDVSQAEARLAGALSTVALRQGTLEISREAFHVATGVYPGNLQPLPALPRIPSAVSAVDSIALRSHPTILRARNLADIAKVNVLRAEAAMLPKVELSGGLGINANSAGGDSASLSVTGTMPLYQGGALASAHRQALALQEKSKSDIQLSGLLVSQNAHRFWAQLQIARASIVARQKEVRASRVALRGIREEADLGARTTLDVLDAEAALFEAEANAVAAKRDEYVAVYSLLSAMGLLTVKHLALGIKTYDPKVNFNQVKTAPAPTNRGKLLDKVFKRAGKK